MVNTLVDLLRNQPRFVDTLIERSPTGPDLFENVLPSLDGSFVFLASGVRASARRRGMTQALQRSYVAIVERSRWLELLSRASGEDPVSVQPDRRLEWSIYLPSLSHAELGIMLPDDSGTTQLCSVFTRAGAGNVLRFTLSPRIEASIPKTHCSAPDNIGCSGGECGECRLRTIEIRNTEGVICWCPHS
jgi:hypothetical protein